VSVRLLAPPGPAGSGVCSREAGLPGPAGVLDTARRSV